MGKINDRITSGRIALDRALLDWRWWGDDTVVKVWLTILLLANWRDQEWQDMTIKRGSFVTSYENLALASNTSVKRVRTAIQKLVKTGEITQKATNKFQLITVEKYEFYQENFGQTGKQTANKGQSAGNQRANKGQQLNNINKYNKGNNIYKDLPDNLISALMDFEEMRNLIKAPMTDNARKLLLNKLDKLSMGDTLTKIDILNQSTMNNWKSVYPLKENKEVKNYVNETRNSGVEGSVIGYNEAARIKSANFGGFKPAEK